MTEDRRAPRAPEGVDEALELLLPDADAGRRGEAERVADFLRLLQADAGRAGDRTALDFGRARADLERSGRERLQDALQDLCAHHLVAVVGTERFLAAELPERTAPAAWRALDALRAEFDGLADLPSPGERPRDVLARLVESLVRFGSAAAGDLWRARLVAALRGPRAGEAAFRAWADASEDDVVDPRAWCGVVECLLDRGAVHPALDVALECASRFADCARLQRLAVWCALVTGRFASASKRDRGLGPWRGTLPGVLVPLRAELPGCASILSGRVPRAVARGADEAAHLDRSEYGAQLLAVVQRHADGTTELAASDAAPALRARVARWFEDREDVASQPETPEHLVVRTAAPVAWHREDGDRLPHSLGGCDSRAGLLQPILDDAGETCGWLRIECSHHLLPARRRAASLAAAWRRELLRRRGRWEVTGGVVFEARPSADAACHDVFARLADALGIKTARRAWFGFMIDGDRRSLVARGGEGLGDPADAPGGGRLLRRALSCGGAARGDEPDASLYVHAQSAAGVAIALRVGARRIGAFVVESERRRDFDERDAARFAQVAEDHALELRLEQFRADHEARFGRAVHADAACAGFRRFHAALRDAERSPDPLVLVGPTGAGKRVLARWAWFEATDEPSSARAECTALDWLGDRERLPAYLVGVEDLGHADQRRLLRALEAPGAARGVAFGLREEPRAARLAGRLIPELACVLVRESRRVPGFDERRGELLYLAERRLDDAARAVGAAPPELDDAARAFLWRQSWAGNWRDLDARVHRLVRRAREDAVTADELAGIWTAAGDEPVTRLPSRDPSAALLHDALLATATAGGRSNKRRAAGYLGWDPDTLTARLAEAGIDRPDPGRRGASWG